MRKSYQFKVALLSLCLCMFSLMISFTRASYSELQGEDAMKKITSMFKNLDHDLHQHDHDHYHAHDHDLFDLSIPRVEDFFHKHKIFKHKPLLSPAEKPKPHLSPSPIEKPECPTPDDKQKKKHEPNHEHKPEQKAKPKPKPEPEQKPKPEPKPKPSFPSHPFFKKPFFKHNKKSFFNHPKKPIS